MKADIRTDIGFLDRRTDETDCLHVGATVSEPSPQKKDKQTDNFSKDRRTDETDVPFKKTPVPSVRLSKNPMSVCLSKRLCTVVAMLFALLLCSCGGEDTVSRRFPCHFTFHTEWHLASMIYTSLNSYNYYVKISMSTYRGAYVVNTVDPRGKEESITLTNDMENLAFNSGIYLGAGGANGSIIIGKTNFNGFVAWDGQCPNCATGFTTRYPLQWTDNLTTVVCNNCHRTYSLETGAILSGNKGDRLMAYIISYAPNGVLGIGN